MWRRNGHKQAKQFRRTRNIQKQRIKSMKSEKEQGGCRTFYQAHTAKLCCACCFLGGGEKTVMMHTQKRCLPFMATQSAAICKKTIGTRRLAHVRAAAFQRLEGSNTLLRGVEAMQVSKSAHLFLVVYVSSPRSLESCGLWACIAVDMPKPQKRKPKVWKRHCMLSTTAPAP